MATFRINCLFFIFFCASNVYSTSLKISSLGFNKDDVTDIVKEAFNSSFDTIVFDDQGSNWIIKPCRFFDLKNKTILFEMGVVVAAKANEFAATNAELFKFVRCSNLHFIGYGAILQMNKSEYIAYNDSEYRHGMAIENCINISVKGLVIKDSGGDGLYIGGANWWQDTLTYSENILIQDVKCDNNYRQGMSITSVQNMKVVNCHFTNTVGTLPEAGIDVEPFEPYQRIVNLEISQCRFANNGWAGLAIALVYMDSTSLPTSIKVSDCIFSNNCRLNHPYGGTELFASASSISPVKGQVLFERCAIDGSNYSALYSRKTVEAYDLTFKDCVFHKISKLQYEFNEPIFLEVPDYDKPSKALGGIHFENVTISYDTDFPFFRVYGWATLEGIKDISGNLTLFRNSTKEILLEKVADTTNFNLTFTSKSVIPSSVVKLDSDQSELNECEDGTAVLTATIENANAYTILIPYRAEGSAMTQQDYNLLPGAVVIGSNAKANVFNIRNIKDLIQEDVENLKLNLVKNEFNQSDDFVDLSFFDCKVKVSDFDYGNNGKRVCLVESSYDEVQNKVTIELLDADQNKKDSTSIFRRLVNGTEWMLMAEGLLPDTTQWIDSNVVIGLQYEYKVRRSNTWNYQDSSYDAIGYTSCATLSDRSDYKGQMILLVSEDVAQLIAEIHTLKKDLTADGWYVNQILVPRAKDWDSGIEVVSIKNKIKQVYDEAPINDKPQQLFILGHVSLPRAGLDAITPDDHNENKGARGADGYYADVDGVYTDTASYNPGGLATALAINLPNDYKWDQDFYNSDLEMGFGRVDFSDLTESTLPELDLYKNYLDKLHKYKTADDNFRMGNRSAYFVGYDNSTDGSYRSLPSISKWENVVKNNTTMPHPQWVKENGPFLMYNQNLTVPDFNEWRTYGMDALVYSSDQSYYGFGDVPQQGLYSRIRALSSLNTRNLVNIWSTMAINLFPLLGTGESIGEATKRIMNHNKSNQYYEKPLQDFDTPEYWYRVQFAMYGDPTIRFYQVPPPKDLLIIATVADSKIYLTWAYPSTQAVERFDVFESTSEFGIFQKIGSTTALNLQLDNYKKGRWYMVKAVVIEETGSGKFYNASLGASIEGLIEITSTSEVQRQYSISPNPVNDWLTINGKGMLSKIEFIDLNGVVLKTINGQISVPSKAFVGDLLPGIYLLKLFSNGMVTGIKKVIKT